MKKLLLVAALLFVAFWIGTLLLIPNPLLVSSVAFIKAPVSKVNSYVLDTSAWKKWWPVGATDNHQYRIVSQMPFGQKLFAQAGSDTFTSELIVLPASPDSSIVEWKTVRPASLNPFTRIVQYRKASLIKDHLQLLLNQLSGYMNDQEKLYGLKIVITNFTNPYMLSTQAEFTTYPSDNEVYQTIGKLRKYAEDGSAVAVDSPMVNIEPMNGKYLLRTALPVDKKLESKNGISFKQMVLGKTLVSTVTGGRHRVEQSLVSMQDFISDFHLTSPAIPFQLWLTNRQQQPDSSKWMTKLYFPIF